MQFGPNVRCGCAQSNENTQHGAPPFILHEFQIIGHCVEIDIITCIIIIVVKNVKDSYRLGPGLSAWLPCPPADLNLPMYRYR